MEEIILQKNIKKYKLENIKSVDDIVNNLKYLIEYIGVHTLNSKNRDNDIFKKFIKDEIEKRTSFLDHNVSYRQRCWHIINESFVIQKCKSCDSLVEFSESRKRYSYYCSIKCCKADSHHMDKLKNTLIEKYGTDNPAKISWAAAKSKKTCMERYGVEKPSQLELFVEKARQTNIARYGAPTKKQAHLVDQIDNYTDPNWLIEQNTTLKKSIIEISKDIGVSPTAIGYSFKKHGIEVKQHYQSIAEKKICEIISQHFEISTKNKKLIYPYELDIYIPEKKVAIEYNGLYWHSDATDRIVPSYHKDKYEMCKNNDIRLITIFENEWEEKEDIVTKKILYILGVNIQEKVFARKTLCKRIDSATKAQFLNKFHIQGDGPSSINYGLYDINGDLVAVIGFIKQSDHFVLNRYATSCNVIGGFSKLLSVFENEFNRPKIFTFADLRWSEGQLYLKNGFSEDSRIKPDYYWIKASKLWHKFNWRHETGLKKLKNYDKNLSETQNMHNHGFNKIYDCGKIKFVKN